MEGPPPNTGQTNSNQHQQPTTRATNKTNNPTRTLQQTSKQCTSTS